MSLLKSYAQSWLFPYRHPKSKGVVEGALYGLGTVLRAVGAAVDDLGALAQGPQGAIKDAGGWWCLDWPRCHRKAHGALLGEARPPSSLRTAAV